MSYHNDRTEFNDAVRRLKEELREAWDSFSGTQRDAIRQQLTGKSSGNDLFLNLMNAIQEGYWQRF